jgi:hypothetical protein
MPSVVIDLAVVVLILGITYALASEGLWGAALMFFNTLFAGLIAFNGYEPLAAAMGSVSALSGYADTLSLMLIFIITLLVLRLITEYLAPTMVRFPAPLYHLGRWLFGLAAACVMMAIILLSFHTAPIHKKMFYGAYPYDLKPPFGLGLDWQWLSFFQYSTGQIFARHSPDNPIDPFNEYGTARVFDPRGSWLIDHQNARPYGSGFVPEPLAEGAGAEGGEGGAAGAGPGVGGGFAPPSSPNAGRGPGIPGGTAGAAVGLAPTNPP